MLEPRRGGTEGTEYQLITLEPLKKDESASIFANCRVVGISNRIRFRDFDWVEIIGVEILTIYGSYLRHLK